MFISKVPTDPFWRDTQEASAKSKGSVMKLSKLSSHEILLTCCSAEPRALKLHKFKSLRDGGSVGGNNIDTAQYKAELCRHVKKKVRVGRVES